MYILISLYLTMESLPDEIILKITNYMSICDVDALCFQIKTL